MNNSLKPLSLLVASEVLLPAISNACVPWWGFRQRNRSVGERKSGQHMSLTSTQRTSWNWECSQCVTNKNPGLPLQTAHVNHPEEEGSQKGSWFLLVQRKLWQHLIQSLARFVLSSSKQMCPWHSLAKADDAQGAPARTPAAPRGSY